MIISSLTYGIRRTRNNVRMVILYYGASIAAGAILFIPMWAILNGRVGHSLVGEALAGRFDMDFLSEFLVNNGGVMSAMTGVMFVAAALYGLVLLFLSGGAFAVFMSDEEYDSSLFWSDAAKYFGRFIRLFLWSSFLLVLLFLSQYLVKVVERLAFGKDPYQYISYWAGIFRVGVGLLALLVYYMIFDFARIYTVVSDERRMHVAIWRGIIFTFRHFFNTIGLGVTWFVFGIAILALYNPLANLLHAPSWFVVLFLFMVQQLYMLFRMCMKLTLYAGEAELYYRLEPDGPAEESLVNAGSLPQQARG